MTSIVRLANLAMQNIKHEITDSKNDRNSSGSLEETSEYSPKPNQLLIKRGLILSLFNRYSCDDALNEQCS